MKGTVKIVTIGSSYTPELMEGFIKRYEELPIKEIWLVDIEDGKEKVPDSSHYSYIPDHRILSVSYSITPVPGLKMFLC